MISYTIEGSHFCKQSTATLHLRPGQVETDPERYWMDL